MEETRTKNCVMLGVDAKYEWILPWWWDNYTRQNTTTVAIVDFGMTELGRRWCRKNLKVDFIDIGLFYNTPFPISKLSSPWFLKPYCLWGKLNAGYEKMCWMDIDCEVRGNIDSIFQYCDDNSIGVTKDPMNGYCRQWMNIPLATGVVVVKPENELIGRWRNDVWNFHKEMRGDQEVFNRLISLRLQEENYTTKINIMPDIYQWLRLYGDNNPNALIMHWTGDVGKEHIRRQTKQTLKESTDEIRRYYKNGGS